MMKKGRIITGVCIALLFIGYVSSCEPIRKSTLEKEFAREFGFKPSTNLTEIKSRTVQVGDTWSHWMRFTYESNTFEKIVASGFIPVTDEMLKDNVITVWERDLNDQPSPNAPSWWKKPENLVGTVFVKDNPYIEGSNSIPSYRCVWVDKTQGIIYSEGHIWQ